jgi:hypothetical protein
MGIAEDAISTFILELTMQMDPKIVFQMHSDESALVA